MWYGGKSFVHWIGEVGSHPIGLRMMKVSSRRVAQVVAVVVCFCLPEVVVEFLLSLEGGSQKTCFYLLISLHSHFVERWWSFLWIYHRELQIVDVARGICGDVINRWFFIYKQSRMSLMWSWMMMIIHNSLHKTPRVYIYEREVQTTSTTTARSDGSAAIPLNLSTVEF